MKIKIGDIIVFKNQRPDPIIHRVVKVRNESGRVFYTTKGDNYITNPKPISAYLNGSALLDETRISQDIIVGKALLRIPFIGYIKIIAVEGWQKLVQLIR